MKIDELTQNDKNMDFKPLDIEKEVQDNVMKVYKFQNAGQMFESGVLLLQTLALAMEHGCNKGYFSKMVDGKQVFYEFNFLGLIEYIKDPNRPVGSTHGVRMKTYDEEKRVDSTS